MTKYYFVEGYGCNRVIASTVTARNKKEAIVKAKGGLLLFLPTKVKRISKKYWLFLSRLNNG